MAAGQRDGTFDSPVAGRDTRTRFQGVYARHKQDCVGDASTRCDCEPSYWGKVWDRSVGRHRKTKMTRTATAARDARAELAQQIDGDELPQSQAVRLRDACESFSRAMKEGKALNKWGRRYKPTAIKDIDECLRVHVLEHGALAKRRIGDVKRRDVQELVDELTPRLSGSRVRSVVNAIRSLYRWAQDRDLCNHDPAQHVRLPAMDATPRDRVATPAEMECLLEALPLEDAVPYALAAYAMGRRAQIQQLTWGQVDLKLGLVGWGKGKTKAAERVNPMVGPLRALLLRAWGAQGKPGPDANVCPPRNRSASGLLETGALQNRAMKAWGWTRADRSSPWVPGRDGTLQPIGLQECRHTAATWMDHAGVSPKIASVLMGHETPERQPGAAHITLSRYTHALPQAFEDARQTLDAWLAREVRRTRETGSGKTFRSP